MTAESRLAAYKKIRLPNESEPYLYIRSSIPLASAIHRRKRRNVQEPLGICVVIYYRVVPGLAYREVVSS